MCAGASLRSPAAVGALVLVLLAAALPAADRQAGLEQMQTLLGQIKELCAGNRQAEAEPLAKQYVALAERVVADQPKVLANSILLLADLEKDLEHFAEADPLYQRVIALRAQALGAEHADVTDVLFRLGNMRFGQGRYAEAEGPYRQVLAAWEKTLGAEHADVANAAYNLANTLAHESRSAEAVPLLARALAIYEKVRGPNHAEVADALVKLADAHYDLCHYAEAEPLLRRALAIYEKTSGPASLDVSNVAARLGNTCHWLGRFAEAETLHRRALAIREKELGGDDLDAATSLVDLADACAALAHYAQAESAYQRALAIREKKLGADDPDVASGLSGLAALRRQQGRFDEAERLAKRALAIREKAFGADSIDVATSLTQLADAHFCQARYAEAEASYRRALDVRRKAFGDEDLDVAATAHGLAGVEAELGRYAEAEGLFKRVLATREKLLGADHVEVTYTLNDLANLYQDTGRLAEAEALHKRALAIREKVLGPDHRDTAASLHNLARVYHARGRYAEAEALFKQALPIWEKALGAEHPDFASSLSGVATLYADQNRYAESEKVWRRCLAIREKVMGPEHPDTAWSLLGLGDLCRDEHRYPEAEKLLGQALAIREKVLGPEHAQTADVLSSLAVLYNEQSRWAEAEPLLARVLAIAEKAFGTQHPDVARALYNMADLRKEQGRSGEAESLVDRAMAILERSQVWPDLQLDCCRLRAELGWKARRRGEALADLRRAMNLAEQLRGQSSGTAHERAQFFGRFADVFEQMVAWQVELGDAAEVLTAMERARARSLLDDLNLAGTDLNVGRPAVERERLRRHEAELRTQIGSLERQLAQAPGAAERERLAGELGAARESLYQYYRDQRSTSPVYRNLLAVGAGPVRLSRLQQMVGPDGLLLVYLLGEENGYVMAIRAGGAEVAKLDVDPAAATTLAIEPGPLTAKRLHAALLNEGLTGVLQRLADRRSAAEATPQLAALWHVLVPEAARQELTGGKLARLVVVPDGPLAMLPLETLVVKPGKQAKYLLDAGPPIVYGPSATVLWNLGERAPATSPAGRKPVLTVGDPAYPTASLKPAERGAIALEALTNRARYTVAGGRLARLPFAGLESTWVASSFRKHGMPAERIAGPEATKARVCREIPGRQVVHLACHGLADQSFGNFFGALALTPGGASADDGFLTLAEIYELDLGGCELAILSACQTNYGPQQQGEGVWALSRGFLVAGARRVVASNWLVDDEAAASLVAYFSAGVAQGEEGGAKADYARALHEAKRWVRRQEKWESPFYWGTFVLVGPN